ASCGSLRPADFYTYFCTHYETTERFPLFCLTFGKGCCRDRPMNFRTTVGVVDSLRRNPLHGTNSCAALDVFPPPERRRAIGKERGMGHRRSCRSCAGTRWPKTACDRPLAD